MVVITKKHPYHTFEHMSKIGMWKKMPCINHSRKNTIEKKKKIPKKKMIKY